MADVPRHVVAGPQGAVLPNDLVASVDVQQEVLVPFVRGHRRVVSRHDREARTGVGLPAHHRGPVDRGACVAGAVEQAGRFEPEVGDGSVGGHTADHPVRRSVVVVVLVEPVVDAVVVAVVGHRGVRPRALHFPAVRHAVAVRVGVVRVRSKHVDLVHVGQPVAVRVRRQHGAGCKVLPKAFVGGRAGDERRHEGAAGHTLPGQPRAVAGDDGAVGKGHRTVGLRRVGAEGPRGLVIGADAVPRAVRADNDDRAVALAVQVAHLAPRAGQGGEDGRRAVGRVDLEQVTVEGGQERPGGVEAKPLHGAVDAGGGHEGRPVHLVPGKQVAAADPVQQAVLKGTRERGGIVVPYGAEVLQRVVGPVEQGELQVVANGPSQHDGFAVEQRGVEVVCDAKGRRAGSVGSIGALKRGQPPVTVVVGVVVVWKAVAVRVVVLKVPVAVEVLHVVGDPVVVEVRDVGSKVGRREGVAFLGAHGGRRVRAVHDHACGGGEVVQPWGRRDHGRRNGLHDHQDAQKQHLGDPTLIIMNRGLRHVPLGARPCS